MRNITTSAALVASATERTWKPSRSATALERLPAWRPTTTLWPLSFRFWAWACPWLP